MADDDLATKALESDSHANNNPSTQASSNPHEACTSNRPTPSSLGTPTGDITTINSIPCYVTKPPSYPHNPGKLLLFLTNGTGVHSTNNQLQADAFAEHGGYIVVMPDQFGGDAAPNTHTTTSSTASNAAAATNDGVAKGEAAPSQEQQESPSIISRIKLGAVEAAKSFWIDMWLARHTPEKVLPRVQAALTGAKEQFADAAANGGGVYGVGYCFGARYIMLLCGRDADETAFGKPSAAAKEEAGDEEGEKEPQDSTHTDPEARGASDTQSPLLKAAATAHPVQSTLPEIDAIRAPISMACINDDQLFPDDVREQGRAALELNNVDHEIRMFEDVPHGFAVVGDYAADGTDKDGRIGEAQKDAFEMMLGFLNKY